LPNATQSFTLIVQKASPTFTNLTGPLTIPFGQASIGLNGRISTADGVIPVGQTATINVVTVPATPPVTSSGFNSGNGGFNATVTTSAIHVGVWSINYNYAGDANFNSTSVLGSSLTVTKANTSTLITSDLPDPSTTVQSVTVNYTVSVTAPGAG